MMKISESELEVMRLLWETPNQPLTFSEIRDALQAEHGWTNSTVKTLIYRLVDKGAVQQEKRDVYYYTSLVDQQAYSAQAMRTMVSKLSGGSVAQLLAGMIEEEAITPQELDELRALLHEKGGRDHE